MRILVVSDTHGDLHSFEQAVLRQPKAEVIIHCGDGAEQAQAIKAKFPDKMMIQVRGNNDWGSTLPYEETVTLGNKKIFITHGHLLNVKFTYQNLLYKARETKANIALFGHTHAPCQEYCDGLYLFNPGSCCGCKATYGYVDITPQGIVTNVLHII